MAMSGKQAAAQYILASSKGKLRLLGLISPTLPSLIDQMKSFLMQSRGAPAILIGPKHTRAICEYMDSIHHASPLDHRRAFFEFHRSVNPSAYAADKYTASVLSTCYTAGKEFKFDLSAYPDLVLYTKNKSGPLCIKDLGCFPDHIAAFHVLYYLLSPTFYGDKLADLISLVNAIDHKPEIFADMAAVAGSGGDSDARDLLVTGIKAYNDIVFSVNMISMGPVFSNVRTVTTAAELSCTMVNRLLCEDKLEDSISTQMIRETNNLYDFCKVVEVLRSIASHYVPGSKKRRRGQSVRSTNKRSKTNKQPPTVGSPASIDSTVNYVTNDLSELDTVDYFDDTSVINGITKGVIDVIPTEPCLSLIGTQS